MVISFEERQDRAFGFELRLNWSLYMGKPKVSASLSSMESPYNYLFSRRFASFDMKEGRTEAFDSVLRLNWSRNGEIKGLDVSFFISSAVFWLAYSSNRTLKWICLSTPITFFL